MTELPDVPSLRVLEPPPGGLGRLRSRLDRPRRRWWLLAVPAVALAALVVWLARPDAVAPQPRADATPLVADPAVGADFYWVSTVPAPDQPVLLDPSNDRPPID